jgi:hypothetical protein
MKLLWPDYNLVHRIRFLEWAKKQGFRIFRVLKLSIEFIAKYDEDIKLKYILNLIKLKGHGTLSRTFENVQVISFVFGLKQHVTINF